MEIDLDVYFWMIDRGVLEDDSRNKIFADSNHCRLFREHYKKLQNGVYIAQVMLMLKKTLIRQHDGPVSIDPSITKLKDNITDAAKLFNWNVIGKELRKFGIKLSQEKKRKLIESESYIIVREILYELYWYDNPDKNKGSLYTGNNLMNININRTGKASFLDSRDDSHLEGIRDGGDELLHNKSSIKPKGVVSIDNVNALTDPNDTETVLEYILTTISQAMNLTPKQSAGLLSNNNKYLVHVWVKGVKGDFDKISQWYQTLYSTCRRLAELIDREEEQGTVPLSLKIVSSGLFSPSYDIVVWCLRVLSKLGSELDIRKLLGAAYEWFIDQDGGLSAIIYATTKHSDIIENVVSVMTQFGKYNMLELFNLHLKNLTPDHSQYMDLITDIYCAVSETFIAKEALVSSGVLDFWIDTAIHQADADSQSTVPEKSSALSFLAEVWISKSERVEGRDDISNTILKLLNKGSRDKSKNLKFWWFAILFKLLEVFTSERNNYAPKIYKSLTFLWVENHHDNDVREFMFKNFSDVFTTIKNIPIAILLESLMKQISISGNITYHFNIFDFEFFQVVAKHPRLHLKLAIDFVDLLGKIIWNDVAFSSSASESFVIILRRYHDHETMQQYMTSFTKIAMKFLINFEKQKKDLEKTHKLEGDKLITGKGKSFIRQISNPEDQKMKWIQKTLFIELLKNVITRIGSIHLNALLKPEIIKTYLHIQKKFKMKHKGLLVLIELFGDVDTLIKEYKELNKNKSAERDDDVDLVSIKSHKVNSGLKNSVRNRHDSMGKSDKNYANMSVQHHSSKMSPLKQQSMKNVTGRKGDMDSELNISVMSEFPLGESIKKNQEKLLYQPESISLGKYQVKQKLTKNEERALKEIEKVKMRRQRRLEDQLFEEERRQMQQEKLKKEIQKELDKRRVEHGVNKVNQKQFKKKSIIRDSSLDRDEPIRKEAKIELYDFSLEEEKDMNAIKNFMNKYRKLLQYLFKTYANTGYSNKQPKPFDQMHDRLETMSLAEAFIMLKNNSVIPDLLHKDEAKTLLRLVNAHILGDKREGKSLTFDAFMSYFLQVAMFIFSRAPINLSQKPPIESVMSLLKLFEKSAHQRGESLKLFENPDHTILADSDIIKELNKLLKKNPNTPMPDGFKKVKIKEYENIFKVPDYFPLPEKNKIALEILDELLNKNFGFHIFEPITKPVITYKAKPVLQQLMKHPIGKKDVPFVLQKPPLKSKAKPKQAKFLEPIPTNAYKNDMSAERGQKKSNSLVKNTRRAKSNRSLPPNSQKGNASDTSRPRQRVYNDITPDINVNLRLEIIKYPMHQRETVQEVAEVLEEVLQAAEKGLTALPPRKKYGLQSYMNQANKAKQDQFEAEQKKAERDKQKYEKHKMDLHQRLQQMRAERQQAESERRQKDKDKLLKLRDKKNKEKEKAKQRIDARYEKEKKKQEEVQKALSQPHKPTQEELKEKEKRKEFLSKRKNQMRKEFNNLSKQRKANVSEADKEERDKQIKKEKEAKLKQFFEKQKELKAQSDAAKKEYMQFYESPDIQKVFEKNFETISEAYLTFAKQQKYTKTAQPGDFQMTFAQFKKFGQDMKLYPKLLSFDDLNYIFKMISKEKSQSGNDNNEEEKVAAKDSLKITFNEFKDALMRIACLGKFKLGGLSGVGADDVQNKDSELKSYLNSRYRKGPNLKGKDDSINRTTTLQRNNSLINQKTLNNSSNNLTSNSRNNLQGNLNASKSQNQKSPNKSQANAGKEEKSSRYAFEKPKKLTKEEQEEIDRERAINAAKSFSLKNFTAKFNQSKKSHKGSKVPDIIYEDTELNRFPEFDTENMTSKTIEVLIKYLADVIANQKSVKSTGEVDIIPASNEAGANGNTIPKSNANIDLSNVKK